MNYLNKYQLVLLIEHVQTLGAVHSPFQTSYHISLSYFAICNANLEIMDNVARYDGSTHNSRIFRESKRRAFFEQGLYGDAVLVGDSGYASANYMMTPLQDCHTPAEQLYNESQIRTRNVIERFFGIWKRRFPVMAVSLRVKLMRVFL